MKLTHGLSFDNIRGDVYGGLTAAVVALPLALVGIRPDVDKTLKKLGVLELLPDDHLQVSRLDALEQAATMIRSSESGELDAAAPWRHRRSSVNLTNT